MVMVLVAVIGAGGTVVAALIARGPGDSASSPSTATVPPGPPLTIYSSLPRQDAVGAEEKQTADMEKSMRLALEEVGGKAGGRTIRYVPLDATNPAGQPTRVEHNARRAAADEHTAVYIGDRTSSASAVSIPILSAAEIPQISPASTRVGLTVKDPTGDTNEPEKYYPTHFRNFVRIIPHDVVQAAALVARMREDGCQRLAMTDDGSDYAVGLSNDMRLLRRPRRVFSESIRPNAAPFVYSELAGRAGKLRADCFVYIGNNNPNTFEVFQAFASKLPTARLYGTDALTELSFRDRVGGTGLPPYAGRVRLMVPPRDLARYDMFLRAFAQRYPRADPPGPYAIYAYEAMRLALDAIAKAGPATRDIRDELFATADREASVLGTYSIDDNGDTTLIDYDVAGLHDGRLGRPVRAISTIRLRQAVRVLQRRAEEEAARLP